MSNLAIIFGGLFGLLILFMLSHFLLVLFLAFIPISGLLALFGFIDWGFFFLCIIGAILTGTLAVIQDKLTKEETA